MRAALLLVALVAGCGLPEVDRSRPPAGAPAPFKPSVNGGGLVSGPSGAPISLDVSPANERCVAADCTGPQGTLPDMSGDPGFETDPYHRGGHAAFDRRAVDDVIPWQRASKHSGLADDEWSSPDQMRSNDADELLAPAPEDDDDAAHKIR